MSETVQEWVTRTPAPPLRPVVERYVGYRMAGFPAGIHRGLPSRHMTFIVAIGAPIDVVAQTDPGQPPATYGAVLSGLQASPAMIAHGGDQEGVAIELTPLGSRTLLGMPAGELWDRSVELSDVVGRRGGELWERLQHPAGWNERFAVCDDVLLRLAGGGVVAPVLGRCWETLVASGGRIGVGELATLAGYSRGHLGRRFRSEFGLPPKLAARVIRFDRAMAMLHRQPPAGSLAQVAVACGYYDQAHLDRDFVEMAGCPPTGLGEDVAFVQDTEGVDV